MAFDNNYDHTYYLADVIPLKNFRKTIPAVIKKLKKYQFDAIAFSGMSGALIAPIVALRMNKPIIMVRKSSEKSHSSRIVEGYKARK